MRFKRSFLLISLVIVSLSWNQVHAAEGINIPLTEKPTAFSITQEKTVSKTTVNVPSETGGASSILPTNVSGEKGKKGILPGNKISGSKVSQETAKEQKELTKNKQITESSKEGVTFGDLILRMLKGLFLVLALIALLTGIVLFYRWIKRKILAGKSRPDIKGKSEEEHKEPSNISEAVSSFVKHRLKK